MLSATTATATATTTTSQSSPTPPPEASSASARQEEEVLKFSNNLQRKSPSLSKTAGGYWKVLERNNNNNNNNDQDDATQDETEDVSDWNNSIVSHNWLSASIHAFPEKTGLQQQQQQPQYHFQESQSSMGSSLGRYCCPDDILDDDDDEEEEDIEGNEEMKQSLTLSSNKKVSLCNPQHQLDDGELEVITWMRSCDTLRQPVKPKRSNLIAASQTSTQTAKTVDWESSEHSAEDALGAEEEDGDDDTTEDWACLHGSFRKEPTTTTTMTGRMKHAVGDVPETPTTWHESFTDWGMSTTTVTDRDASLAVITEKIIPHDFKPPFLTCEEDETDNESEDLEEEIVDDDLRLLEAEQEETLRQQQPKSLESLQFHKILGEGNFGQVWLVSTAATHPHPSSEQQQQQTPYALKVFSKFKLIEDRLVDDVLRECDCLLQLRKHPFIVKLIRAYQDDNLVYLLQEFVQGGELFSLMHGRHETDDDSVWPPLPEPHVRFYGLCLADALQYMHRQRIVYRDMKGENVMIDAHGYPVLIDLGNAKQLQPKELAYTLCGTPRYLSPESLMGNGHSFPSDYWSLGILLYEMLAGRSPFYYYQGMDDMDIYSAITDDPMEPLTSFVSLSAAASDAVTTLLQRNPSNRWKSCRRFLHHAWFTTTTSSSSNNNNTANAATATDLDLHKLRRRQIPAPWMPNVTDPLDTSHFDDWDGVLKDVVHQNNPPKLLRTEQALFDSLEHL